MIMKYLDTNDEDQTSINQMPTLYHKGKSGKIYSWVISTKGKEISVTYGIVDGKKTTTTQIAKGKNIGKKNATTNSQQAELEARSMWQHKLDNKYSQTKEESRETVFLPMLAHDYTKQKKKPAFPFDVQPKLNGCRCMAFWKDGQIYLMSRGGKQYHVPRVEQELSFSLPKDFIADGELYIHGMLLQDIMHIVKHPESDEQIALEYRIYDGFYVGHPDTKWSVREVDLCKIFQSEAANIQPHIKKVVTDEVNNNTELQQFQQGYIAQGYEGVIIRLSDGLYDLGQRSRYLLKLKTFQDAEYKIVGFEQATGNDIGTVVWVCETKDHKQFSVRPKGTREQRTEYYNTAPSYLGRLLTVKYQEDSKDGIPLFPVGMCIRIQEDL
jgi:DNA ligase 1